MPMPISPKAVLTCCAVTLWAVPAFAQTAKVQRHLEYHFTVGILSTTTTHSSGIENAHTAADPSGPPVSASGINEFRAGDRDEGTIAVDVLGVQADNGVVLAISERANDKRSAAPATCVAYGNTFIICDESKRINPEEVDLVRLLGKNFSRLKPLDSSNHWQYTQQTPQSTELTDFTIKDNKIGVVSIDMRRDVQLKGAGGFRASTSGNIVYDRGFSIPTSLDERTVSDVDQGSGQSARTEFDLTLKLVSDSMAQPAH